MPSFHVAKKLTHLDISNNGLSGGIPSSHFEGLYNLVTINLHHNSISGSIPSSIFTLPSLQKILLSHNQFSKLDEFINVSCYMLSTLELNNNNLSGPFPMSIFQLSTLPVLILSYNKLSGPIQLNTFSVLRNLTALDLSYNNLSVNVDVTNADPSSFPNLIELDLASCNLKTFPGFLMNQSTLNSLDISNNQIQGKVPNWIWKLQNLLTLNISHNLLTDLEGPLQNLSSNLISLDLHNNQLQGPIPVFTMLAIYLDYSRNKFGSVIPQDIGNYLSGTNFLSLSNNNLHGSIPDSLCNATSLEVLDLSINNISGPIPSCLMSITKSNGLGVLINLRKNNLEGLIPDTFPTSCALKTLVLNGNLLHGPVPKSLAYCSTLEVLDIGTNQIVGGFPCFLKNIPTLRVLVLWNNKFQGSIGCSEANKPWQMIQIVDIAFNNFSGKLPEKYFTTWETMMHNEVQAVTKFVNMDFQMEGLYYQFSMTVVNKGQLMELVKILTIFTTIDFSFNHFEGPIPEEIMDFESLHVLNFSNNAFSGEIPSSIGNLKQLKSLDLSHNSLGGEIPVQLASLSFLSYLNLSFNHLVGKIPTGTQLQSFQASSFEGNDGLYGPPLAEKPDGERKELLPQPTCRRLACSIEWNFISAEMGFLFGIGIVTGPS